MDEEEISRRLDNRSRRGVLDDYEEYIVHLLETYPRLSAVKVLHSEKVEELKVSKRSMRRYLRSLSE